ncbi:LysR family transcriptional regulator [Vibrio inusitatus NBRC 102082]|uniref:LysR family transcriptional regulator n=1 Tax=Vibrio inusitatus NBRC 102082 TaxID=1219070 RepID=A0A4Y3HU50_9VIBR|nr:LysR family transcriptional regulator [Vibrio inusitatus NBRC 102082]
MFVSQSAVSRSLARLRDTFDDPLFTRVASGLVPTEKALEIEKQLLSLLPQVSEVFSQQAFDPKKADSAFAISLPALLSSPLTPLLMKELKEIAPAVRVSEYAAKANPYSSLDQGQIDFALYFADSANPRYVSKQIGTLKPQLFVRPGHPLLVNNDVDIEDTFAYSMVGMAIEEDQYHSFSAPITKIYKDLMVDRRPILRSSQTQVLIDVVSDSDAILFGTNCLQGLRNYGEDFVQLKSAQIESNDTYSVPVFLMYHERSNNSAAHQWMGELLSKKISELLV